MSTLKRPSLKDPEILFVTFLGSGLSPWAPGTAGSLAILLPLYFLGQMKPPFFFFIPILTMLSVASWYLIGYVERKHNVHDPKWIVIDEVVGLWLTTLFIQSNELTHFLLCFIWFRVFDILKPWPVSYFDKLESPFGTLFDDIVAGFLAGIFYLLTIRVIF
jgi:phosphatidylglycerophosphatase A